jgi:hypothetical protein
MFQKFSESGWIRRWLSTAPATGSCAEIESEKDRRPNLRQQAKGWSRALERHPLALVLHILNNLEGLVMNAITLSAIVFVCLFGGSLFGMYLRSVLPEEHLSAASRDLVKMGTGTIATMTALILGLLVASAKGSYDNQSRELTEMSAKIVLLDRALAHYGPDAKNARELLRSATADMLERTWSGQASRHSQLATPGGSEVVYDAIQELSPQDDAHRSLQTRALNMAVDIGQMRWLMAQQEQSSFSKPLLAVVIFSFIITFASFSLHSSPNGTVITTLLVCALSVSAAIFLVLEMYAPYSGVIQIPSDPLRSALAQLGR